MQTLWQSPHYKSIAEGACFHEVKNVIPLSLHKVVRCDSLGGDFVCESGKRSKNAKINELENRGIRFRDQMFGNIRFSTDVETGVEKRRRIYGIFASFPAPKPQNCGKLRLYTLRIHNFHRVFHNLSRSLHPINIPQQMRKVVSTFPNFPNIAP